MMGDVEGEAVLPSCARWYANGIVYQVFPDTYRRDANWHARATAGLQEHANGPARSLVEDWNTPPQYRKNEEGHITHWDFYGGSLKGITQDLGRLAAAGITILYLNPIFCAASSHRYDTADYLHVDPILGTDEDFEELCSAARNLGISIILDGVFAHTGRDSRYFNRFANFSEPGAFQGSTSPWHSWYTFHEDGSYDCWHDIDDLPSLNPSNPEVRAFLCGQDGVLRHWIRAGARGWRLDSADKLPDDLIAQMRQAVLAECPDAVLIGELWENAAQALTDKGQPRRYLNGHELDGVTNYPFCCMLSEFLCGDTSASHFAGVLNSLYDEYSPAAFAGCLNMLGSHDTPRILSVLGEAAPTAKGWADQSSSQNVLLNPEQRRLAKARLRLATLVQFALPGVPCIYAGDEAGVEGLGDPHNRAAYPWGREDADCLRIYREAIELRHSQPVLVDGTFHAFAPSDDVFGFWRESHECSMAIVVNRSASASFEVKLPHAIGSVCEYDCSLGSHEIWQDSQDGMLHGMLAPLDGIVLCFSHEKRAM